MITAIIWLISLNTTTGPVYYRKTDCGLTPVPRNQATEYQDYKSALDDRFKYLGRGVNFEITLDPIPR